MGRGQRLLDRVTTRRRTARLPERAWFDAAVGDSARAEVADRATHPGDVEVLRSWVDHGYAIVEGLVPEDLIDEMLAALDRAFLADDPIAGMVLHDLLLADGHRPAIEHTELVRIAHEERVAARDRSSWRTHGFHQHSAAADQIRRLPELERLASMLLGAPATARYSINFRNGSTQQLHEDSAVFHLGVPNLICGAWIACEDIDAASGPLVFCPGSHRRRMFDGFAGYPLTNLRTVDADTSRRYHAHVEHEAEGFERRTFLARKGDVLLWHGMLIHGGDAIREPGTTRRSYVLHYLPDGVDVAHEVTGPTNW